jgi:hypothetical protein
MVARAEKFNGGHERLPPPTRVLRLSNQSGPNSPSARSLRKNATFDVARRRFSHACQRASSAGSQTASHSAHLGISATLSRGMGRVYEVLRRPDNDPKSQWPIRDVLNDHHGRLVSAGDQRRVPWPGRSACPASSL